MDSSYYIWNVGCIKRTGIAETVIIKLDRQREFFAERGGDFSVSKREFPVALLNTTV